MLCAVLSEFLQSVLPFPCNVCISVTSERRQGDFVTSRAGCQVQSWAFSEISGQVIVEKSLETCRYGTVFLPLLSTGIITAVLVLLAAAPIVIVHCASVKLYRLH